MQPLGGGGEKGEEGEEKRGGEKRGGRERKKREGGEEEEEKRQKIAGKWFITVKNRELWRGKEKRKNKKIIIKTDFFHLCPCSCKPKPVQIILQHLSYLF